MSLVKGLLTGALIMSTHFAMAAEPISRQEILQRYLQDRYPQYYTYSNQALGIEDQIKDSWRLQAEDSRTRDFYTKQRQALRRDLVAAEERSSRLRKQAIHELNDITVENRVYQIIEAERKSAKVQPLQSSSGLSAWMQEQKPAMDAHYAKVEALNANSDIKNKSFFLIDEAAKGTKDYIKELKLTTTQKTQVVQAQEEYKKLMDLFRGTDADSVFARLKVLSEGKMGNLNTPEKFRAVLNKMHELNKGLEAAGSKEQLLTRSSELMDLVRPHTAVLDKYRSQNYKILFGFKDPIIQSGKHQVILDESGKVKGILQNGTSSLKGKMNLKKALASLGLSTLAISSLADEVASVEETSPAPSHKFQSKNWAQESTK